MSSIRFCYNEVKEGKKNVSLMSFFFPLLRNPRLHIFSLVNMSFFNKVKHKNAILEIIFTSVIGNIFLF